MFLGQEKAARRSWLRSRTLPLAKNGRWAKSGPGPCAQIPGPPQAIDEVLNIVPSGRIISTALTQFTPMAYL